MTHRWLVGRANCGNTSSWSLRGKHANSVDLKRAVPAQVTRERVAASYIRTRACMRLHVCVCLYSYMCVRPPQGDRLGRLSGGGLRLPQFRRREPGASPWGEGAQRDLRVGPADERCSSTLEGVGIQDHSVPKRHTKALDPRWCWPTGAVSVCVRCSPGQFLGNARRSHVVLRLVWQKADEQTHRHENKYALMMARRPVAHRVWLLGSPQAVVVVCCSLVPRQLARVSRCCAERPGPFRHHCSEFVFCVSQSRDVWRILVTNKSWFHARRMSHSIGRGCLKCAHQKQQSLLEASRPTGPDGHCHCWFVVVGVQRRRPASSKLAGRRVSSLPLSAFFGEPPAPRPASLELAVLWSFLRVANSAGSAFQASRLFFCSAIFQLAGRRVLSRRRSTSFTFAVFSAFRRNPSSRFGELSDRRPASFPLVMLFLALSRTVVADHLKLLDGCAKAARQID